MNAFGLSTHLFHGDRLSKAQIEATRDHGFPLIEIFATHTHFPYRDPAACEEVRRWLDACEVSAWSVHAPICDGLRNGIWGRAYSNASRTRSVRDEAVAETVAAVGAAQRLGASVLVLHLGIPADQPVPDDDNDAAAVAEALRPIADACDRAGIRLALEVIPNALATADAVGSWLEGDRELGRTGACLDVGHAHLIGGAPEAVERLSGHLLTTHIHDNHGTSDDHLVPFDGTVDWAATCGALVKVGYGGPFIFELPSHGDVVRTLTRAAAARTRLQSLLTELHAPFPFSDDL